MSLTSRHFTNSPHFENNLCILAVDQKIADTFRQCNTEINFITSVSGKKYSYYKI